MAAHDDCVIRPAALADLDGVHALEKACFDIDAQSRRSLRYLASRAQADFLVALDGACIVADAVVLYRRNSGVARLYSIAVGASARGRGVASALLRECETGAQRRGCRAMRAEARLSNLASRGLFQRAGYRENASLPSYYAGRDGRREDGVRLEKPLT